MITFLGWLFLFIILIGITSATPLFGFILFIIAGFYNPLFWLFPSMAVGLLLLVFILEHQSNSNQVDDWTIDSD